MTQNQFVRGALRRGMHDGIELKTTTMDILAIKMPLLSRHGDVNCQFVDAGAKIRERSRGSFRTAMTN